MEWHPKRQGWRVWSKKTRAAFPLLKMRGCLRLEGDNEKFIIRTALLSSFVIPSYIKKLSEC
jgi:hypothetical protein